MKTRNSFKENEISAFQPAEKIGLVACVNPEGQVHTTLITSMHGPQQMVHAAKARNRVLNYDHGQKGVAG